MSTRRFLAWPGVILAASIATVLLVLAPAATGTVDASPLHGAQQDPEVTQADTDQLRIESVTPWVAADGEFQVRFAPSPSLPPDARLTVTVHQSLRPSSSDTLRSELLSIIDGGPPGRILQAPITTPLSELGDVTTGLVVTLPVRATRADSDRVLLPNPGIHPIELVLTAADGPELWRDVVFLNRLPVEVDVSDGIGTPEDRVAVSLVLPLDSAPAVGTTGEATFSLEDRNVLSAAGSLLQRLPDAPLLVTARPNTLDGLSRVGQRWADTVLESLSAPGTSSELGLSPYVELDVAALLAADARRVVDRQLLVGAGTVITRTTRTPVVRTWTSDDPIDSRALSALAQSGFESAFVPADSLLVDDVTDEQLMTTPFRFEGESNMTGLAYDEQISTLLAEGGSPAGSRAHAATTLLMANWFTGLAESDAPRAAAILLSPTTDPTTIELLSAALGEGGPLEADPGAALPQPGDSTVALAPRSLPERSDAVDAFDATMSQLDSYRSMTGEADPALALWSILNDESMAAGLDPAGRNELHTAVADGISARLAQIELPRSRRVVLTSEDSSIPLRLRNGLDFDVTLNLEARSARLDLGDDGRSEIVLVPGENRVDLPVEVQAPGETLLRLRVSAPDGGLDVGAVEVPVRSTGISGVGAALSVVSIGFLLLWWIHTHRRSRRERARTSGAHPAAEPPRDPGAPVEVSAPAGALTADRLERGG